LKKILPLFSYLFHPIFIPVFGTLFYLFFTPNYFEIYQKYLLLLQVTILFIFIPITFYSLLKTLGRVDNIMLSDISQRKIPLLFQVFLIVIVIQKSITADKIPELFFFLSGGLISTILAFLFLFVKRKASIHMLGISALTMFVIGLSIHTQINFIYSIAFLVLINGLVASSRLEMKAHNNTELIIGFLIGSIPQVALWFFWL